MLHTLYGTYHLARPAGGRTPGSSGAYHTFAAAADIAIIPLYAYGALASSRNSDDWSTLLPDTDLAKEYFLPATYYTLIGAGSCHVLSLLISIYLALMFRRIHQMPPDMNPLESHYTTRTHKRNKSSVATFSTYSDGVEKRLSTPLSEHRRSGAPYENVSLSRPPSIPFMHTRQGSETSFHSRTGSQTSLHSRSSRVDLPSRQYQIAPANTAPPTPPIPPPSSWRNSYVELPKHDQENRPTTAKGPASPSRPGTAYHDTHSRPTTSHQQQHPHPSRPSTGTNASYRTANTTTTLHAATPPTPPAHRPPRFTEAWFASESLVARTNARQKSYDRLNGSSATHLPMPGIQKSYEALGKRYNDDDEESVSMYSDDENIQPRRRRYDVSSDEEEDGAMTPIHPLRSNPTTPHSASKAKFVAGGKGVLGEVSANDRRVSNSHDIADQRTLNRKSSIQPESEFVAKPYGLLGAELRKETTTPAVLMVGSNRVVSSGYDDGKDGGGRFGGVFGRRNVSGKVVEEGRAGGGQGARGLWEHHKEDYRDW
jgi:hypothetical protein